MEEISINWKNYFQLILKLSKKITFKPNVIICINRGGLIIGRVFSEIFDKPLAVISAKSYNNKNRGKLKIGSISTICPIKGKILLVDDKVESGQTLERIKNKIKKLKGIKEVRTAYIYTNPESEYMPDYYTKEISCWVIFPYEKR